MYESENTIAFWDEYTPYYEFNNSFPCRFEMLDKTWPSVEHYYQAIKFRPDHPELVEKIRSAKTAKEAIQLAENNKDKVRTDSEWNSNYVYYMEAALRYDVRFFY